MGTQSQECCPGTNKLFHTLESTFLFGFYSKLGRATEEKRESLFLPRKPCRVYQELPSTGARGTGSTETPASAAQGSGEEEEGRVALAAPDTTFIWPIQARCCASSLATCSESLTHVPGAPPRCPGSAGLKGCAPRVRADPSDPANSACSHSNVLTFKGKAYLLQPGTVTAVQISPLQRHGSGRSTSPGGSGRPQTISAGRRGGLAHTAHSRERPGPCTAEPGTSDCSPFFRRQKIPINFSGSRIGPRAQKCSGFPSPYSLLAVGLAAAGDSNAAGMCGAAAGGFGSPGPARSSSLRPSPARAVRAAVNTSHVRYKRCPQPPGPSGRGNADAISRLLCRLCRQTRTHGHPRQDKLFIMLSTFHFSLQIIPAPSPSPRHILPCQMICDRLMTYYIVIAAKMSKQGC